MSSTLTTIDAAASCTTTTEKVVSVVSGTETADQSSVKIKIVDATSDSSYDCAASTSGSQPISIETMDKTGQILERLHRAHISPKSPAGLSAGSIPDDEQALCRDDLNKVHEELEKLNIATDVINKLELQLDEARTKFRDIQSSWSQRLEHLHKKLGHCIEKSRPYYEARLEARRIHEQAHQACIRFERANSLHQVAKQQVALTQESLNRQQGKGVDPACLEVLNHHVQRVNEAEAERIASEEAHRRVSIAVADVNARVQALEKDLSRSIKKSRTYFEARVEFTRVLEQQKLLIGRLEQEIKQKKADYTQSLRNLERISERIHEERQAAGLTPSHSARDLPAKEEVAAAAAVVDAQLSCSSTDNVSMAPSSVPEDPTLDSPPAVAAVAVSIAHSSTSSEAAAPVVDLQLQDAIDDDQGLTNDKIERLVVEDTEAAAKQQAASQQQKKYMTRNARSERSLIEKFLNRVSSDQQQLNQQQHSGVLLLPSDLTGSGNVTQSASDAYRMPNASNVEHLDLSYRTVPEGVKAELTPPSSARSFKSTTTTASSSAAAAANPGSGHESDNSDAVSIASTSTGAVCLDDDERIASMLKSHSELIQEISDSASRAAQQLSVGRAQGHARSISEALKQPRP